MKLCTSITPRRDRTVVVVGADGRKHVLKSVAAGEDPVGDVDDDELVARLLAGGAFYPYSEADFERALSVAGGESLNQPSVLPIDSPVTDDVPVTTVRDSTLERAGRGNRKSKA